MNSLFSMTRISFFMGTQSPPEYLGVYTSG